MISLLRMFQDGGPVMYLLALLVPIYLVAIVVQVVLAKRVNMMPLLWGLVLINVLVGLLGTVMGGILSFSAVAQASAEMKAALMANGIAISLYTVSGALMSAIPQVFLTGVAGSIVATAQRPKRAD